MSDFILYPRSNSIRAVYWNTQFQRVVIDYHGGGRYLFNCPVGVVLAALRCKSFGAAWNMDLRHGIGVKQLNPRPKPGMLEPCRELRLVDTRRWFPSGVKNALGYEGGKSPCSAAHLLGKRQKLFCRVCGRRASGVMQYHHESVGKNGQVYPMHIQCHRVLHQLKRAPEMLLRTTRYADGSGERARFRSRLLKQLGKVTRI